MRFVRVIIVVLFLILSPGTVHAARTAGITVPEAGSYYYWFTYTDVDGNQVATTPVGFDGKKTTVDLPLVKDAIPKCTLFVLDVQTGNEAVIPVEGKPDKPLKFDPESSDFDRVRRVEIAVTSASTKRPAAAAIVKIEDSDKKVQTQVLDPSSNGIAQFTDVAAGTVKVTVQYGEGKTSSQDVEVPLDREEMVPSIEIPVVGEIETVQAAAETGAEKETRASGRQTGRGIDFPTAFVGLILFVGIVYLAVITMRNRGAGFRQMLRKVGVELPEEPQQASAPSQPAPAPQVDPGICPFCGSRRDPATGECACSVGPAPPVSRASRMTGVGAGPRLVATQGAYAGSIYTLEGDAVTLGREESNTIAFSQDNTVSRRHARITGSGGEFTIYDEGSSNGTFVNGVRITEQVLRPGDEIQIGNTKLRFEA